ncbi:hypothetical protein B0H19DRAFT_1088257 [Mycena capillaripes]|nr:hypothetical protein B0H19DRAFT_1088257 [Mycena capillaripes]
MCLQLFGHRCWQYNPDLSVLFPSRKSCMSLDAYLEEFVFSIRNAPKIANIPVSSVAYCRTRRTPAYPFLIVHLQHPHYENDFPVRLKMQGFDDPATSPMYNTLGEGSTFSIASVNETVRELVGTWRYDVVHTMTFPPPVLQPTIVDLLALADPSIKWDNTREGYPATLFLAMKVQFSGFVISGAKATPLPRDVSAEVKSAVVDALPVRRQRMQEHIEARTTRIKVHRFYPDSTGISEILTDNELETLTTPLVEEVFV